MTDTDNRNQALLNTALAQRNAAMDQVVELSGDLAVANARIAQLEARVAQIDASAPAAGA